MIYGIIKSVMVFVCSFVFFVCSSLSLECKVLEVENAGKEIVGMAGDKGVWQTNGTDLTYKVRVTSHSPVPFGSMSLSAFSEVRDEFGNWAIVIMTICCSEPFLHERLEFYGQVLLLLPSYWWGYWRSERLSPLSKAAELGHVEHGIQ